MTTTTTATTDFYTVGAVEIYEEDFDFTVVTSAEPLPTLAKVVRSVFSRALAMAAVALTAGILTIQPGDKLTFGISEPTAVADDGTARATDVVTMTAYMRERAVLAAQLFERTPHPGSDDDEPDYGF